MNENALVPAHDTLPEAIDRTDPRAVALVKALGLDKAAPEQVDLTLAIARQYDLDPMLKHITLIDGRPYITRDGLLSVAHRSKQLDGIEVTDPVITDVPGPGNATAKFWTCKATVYRKDMSRPFTYPGRYPVAGGWNTKFAPEMAIKVAESMALRRAFNVAAPSVEERWDVEVPAEGQREQPERQPLAAVVQDRLRDTGRPDGSGTGPVGRPSPPVSGEAKTGAHVKPEEGGASADDPTQAISTTTSGSPSTATIPEATNTGGSTEPILAYRDAAEEPDPAVVASEDQHGLTFEEFTRQAREKGILTGLACRAARELWPDRAAEFRNRDDIAAMTGDERLAVLFKALDMQEPAAVSTELPV